MERHPGGASAEHEPLLTRDELPIEDAEPIREPDENDSVEVKANISESKLKLAATAFDFWTTGIVVAAIGVCMPP